ncbi:Phage shock protein PspC (stress-responsive transcriptional regulator) [Sinosporangium album]|uniref:Phage shock protein PspC (Stress-responsive transcriptional regulator) n=1 Tax=Sinosporangium album TaxID=504805 RepID=A0A1G8H1A4_9ACTN|nr:Phage shock protein PspC (stress-responsive transcriptional regulator) [Sinosporangium album]
MKKLSRSQDGRIIAGVCSGIGRFLGVDANIVRFAMAAATLFGGLGVGAYVVGWLLLPDETQRASILQDLVDRHKNGAAPWQQNKAGDSPAWGTEPPRYDSADQFRPTGAYGDVRTDSMSTPGAYGAAQPSRTPQQPQVPAQGPDAGAADSSNPRAF